YTWTIPAATKVTGIKGKNATPCSLCNDEDGEGMNKPDFIKIIGFVSMYDANDLKKNEVLNSTEEESIFGVGINIPAEFGSVYLYPVPANNSAVLYLNLTEKTNLKYQIVNSVGQVVTEQTNNMNPGEQTVQLNTESFANGVYFININANGKTATKRFVVAH
ncbi:MAG: T9SS type A sorting domain-containing protein, partial [Bacteroidetes bacterium]|nr:T9SS type A sorting domain-containing protein [Bacteroidota bacterium]